MCIISVKLVYRQKHHSIPQLNMHQTMTLCLRCLLDWRLDSSHAEFANLVHSSSSNSMLVSHIAALRQDAEEVLCQLRVVPVLFFFFQVGGIASLRGAIAGLPCEGPLLHGPAGGCIPLLPPAIHIQQ